jgi:hypothetical protein
VGIYLSIVQHDKEFHENTKRLPIIINDFAETSEAEKEAFNRKIFTQYDNTDLLSNLPSCECPEDTGLNGEHLLGVTCPICQSKVKSPMEQNLESIVWMRAPKGVAALINPVIWNMLSTRFTKKGYNFIHWLCDTSYKPTARVVPPELTEVINMGFPRGLNNFVANFDAIMVAFFKAKAFRVKKDEEDDLQQLLVKYRDRIFSQYLPLPNRSLLVIEKTNVGTYIDPIVTGAVDAIQTMVSIDSMLSNYSIRSKENRTIKTIVQLSAFYDDICSKSLAKKEGLFRKHVFGTRSHFSFRGVISSSTDQHGYDELALSWGIGVSVFRLHLFNKLFRRGFTPNEAIALLNHHAQIYHPMLDELFKELIAEAPGKGIHCVFQRNPSLERGSAQAMYITSVKTDPTDPTISLSILSVVGLNADFDGDQLNGTLSIDNYTADELESLAPHKSVFDLNSPRSVSKNLSIPKPVVSTIANWMHSWRDEAPNPEKLRRMELLETV